MTHLFYVLRSKIRSLIVIVVVVVVKTWNTYVPKIFFRMFFGRLINHRIHYFRLDCQIREYYSFFFLFDAHGSLFSFSFLHTWIVFNKSVGNIYHYHHHYHWSSYTPNRILYLVKRDNGVFIPFVIVKIYCDFTTNFFFHHVADLIPN